MQKMTLARLLAEEKYLSGWRPKSLLSAGNSKLAKAERNIGLSLAPSDTSGYEVCASKSVLCAEHCIHTSGLASPNLHAPDLTCNPVWVARALKTIWFFKDRQGFMAKLYRDVANNRDSAIRQNVFSDWMWERQSLVISETDAQTYGTKSGQFASSLMEISPDTQFYDYTKHFKRMFRPRPANYHLTFSLTEDNLHQAPAGQTSDYIGARALLSSIPQAGALLADRGCDADWFRNALIELELSPCIPSTLGREVRHKMRCFIACAIRSGTCSPASRPGAGSRCGRIDAPSCSSRRALSPQSSSIGYEAGP